jgi:hypothetical protein
MGRLIIEGSLGEIGFGYKYIEDSLKIKEDIIGAQALKIIVFISQNKLNEAYMLVVNIIKKKANNIDGVLFFILK